MVPGVHRDAILLHGDGEVHGKRRGTVIVVAQEQGLDRQGAAVARAKQVVGEIELQILAARREGNAAVRLHFEEAALQVEAADGQFENVLHGGSLTGAANFRLGDVGAPVSADDQIDMRIGDRERLYIHVAPQNRNQLEAHHDRIGPKQRRPVRRLRPVNHEVPQLRRADVSSRNGTSLLPRVRRWRFPRWRRCAGAPVRKTTGFAGWKPPQ